MKKIISSLVVFFVLFIAACALPNGNAENHAINRNKAVSPPAGECPVFYRDSAYRGESYALPAGTYTMAQLQLYGIRNNDISSLKVPQGYIVKLWDLDNFSGTGYKFTADCPDLYYANGNTSDSRNNQFNDKTSSIQIYYIPTYIALNSFTTKHQYVCADLHYGSQAPLYTNRDRIGPWETFELIQLGGSKIALRSKANGLYVCAEDAGNGPLIANRSEVGLWETFEMYTFGDRWIALKSMANNKYVCAESDGTGCLIANRDVVGSWETFEKVPLRNISTEPTLAPEMVDVAGGSKLLQGRSVTLTSFKMSTYEVTYELWYSVKKWAEANGYCFYNLSSEGDDGVPGAPPTENRLEPVMNVPWFEQIVWCNALSEKEGLTPCYSYKNEFIRDARYDNWSVCGSAECNWFATGYRLATEAEWEYAARGGQSSYNYPNYPGADVLNFVGWWINNSWVGTIDKRMHSHSVGTRYKNELGLYDMAGNGSEWCWDWADTSLNYQGLDPATPPGDYNFFRYRSWKGGGYFSDYTYCKMGYRGACEARVGMAIRLVKRYGE
jgi:sulfatase modifying factor 1